MENFNYCILQCIPVNFYPALNDCIFLKQSTLYMYESVDTPLLFFCPVFDTLFPSSVPVNKESVSTSQKFIQKCQANMGSTDIWRPLHSLQLLSCGSVSERNTNTDTLPPKSVFIVSDGHMTEEAPTISAIKEGLKSSRVFTFGVR